MLWDLVAYVVLGDNLLQGEPKTRTVGIGAEGMIQHRTGLCKMKGICFGSLQEGPVFHGEIATVALVVPPVL